MTPSHGAPFRGYRDDSESPFFCAAGHTPEETWELSVDRLTEILEMLGALAATGPIEMSCITICSVSRSAANTTPTVHSPNTSPRSSATPTLLDDCSILKLVIKYTDYHGPQGDYAVVDGKIVPFDHDVARRFAQNAHLLALGDPKRAAKMVAEAERAERERITA